VRRTGILLVLVSLAAACAPPVLQPGVPALLTNPGPETLQEIEQTIATALGVTKVTLAADVLTKTSVIIIERGMQRGIDRPPELGRDPGRPDRFQLIISGSQCVLVNDQNGVHWPLVSVECIKE
jgi:hypothetical protein